MGQVRTSGGWKSKRESQGLWWPASLAGWLAGGEDES
uniref:Uncharacterized protein n=1 Tax=Fagus sylvatica TaxID=28930 RepID=A0A2N9F456_FAGSY